MIRVFSLLSLTMVLIMVYSAPALGNSTNSQLQRVTDNIKVIGAITQSVQGKSVGIVILKDKTTKKTQAVQIGKVFTIGKQALRIVKQDGKNLVFSNGRELVSVSYNNGTPSGSQGWKGGGPGRTYRTRTAYEPKNEVTGDETELASDTPNSRTTNTGMATSLEKIQQEMAEVEIGVEEEEADTAMAVDELEDQEFAE